MPRSGLHDHHYGVAGTLPRKLSSIHHETDIADIAVAPAHLLLGFGNVIEWFPTRLAAAPIVDGKSVGQLVKREG